jgi:hypothetical protein
MDKLELVLEYMTRAHITSVLGTMAGEINMLRDDVAYWEKKAGECNTEPLHSRIALLEQQLQAAQSDKAYWEQIADQKRKELAAGAMVRDKQMCALGMVNLCQPYYKQMLDALFLDTPDYYEAWTNAPWQLVDAVMAIPKDKKIERIKLVRQWLPGLGLKAAKDFVESYYDYK